MALAGFDSKKKEVMGITSAKKRGHNDSYNDVARFSWPDLPGHIDPARLKGERDECCFDSGICYIYTLLAYVIASWLIAFKIINSVAPLVRWILQSLGGLHEPLLSRIRNVLSSLGGIDISPIIVLLAVQFLRNILFEYLS